MRKFFVKLLGDSGAIKKQGHALGMPLAQSGAEEEEEDPLAAATEVAVLRCSKNRSLQR
jgi:hypothetical protein